VNVEIAIIGGSGLHDIAGITVIEELNISTPFGPLSDKIKICDIGGTNTAFINRHGKGHRYLPTEVPSKANIWALKSIGVSQIIAISAVGSLQENIKHRDFVVCDQLIDRTKNRKNSFFGDGAVGHVGFADPYCEKMRQALIKVLKSHNHPYHNTGTLVCMEGPPFSTRAESNLHRSWGADLIGMTALPEAKLAREAEICLANISMVTDYDCWKESDDVSVSSVLEVMKDNSSSIKRMFPDFVKELSKIKDCKCRNAAEFALMTDPGVIPEETKKKLNLFYSKYWK
jgi:5'-methylthioadenosine phosphorylase